MGRRSPEDDSLEVVGLDGGPLTAVPSTPAPSLGRTPAPRAVVVWFVLLGLVVLGGAAVGTAQRDGGSRSRAEAAGDGPRPTAPKRPAPMSVVHSWPTPAGDLREPPFTRLDPVLARTTAAGLVIITQRPGGLRPPCDASSWCPPPECRSQLAFLVTFTSAVGSVQGDAVDRPAVTAPPAYVGETATGPLDGGELFGFALVRAPAGASTVDLRIGEGTADTAPVVDGWAAVAAPLEGPGHLFAVAHNPAGGEVARLPLDHDEPPVNRTPPARCEAPAPPLPPAGADQPPDPATAAAAVRTAYTHVFEHGQAKESRLANVDDTRDLDAPMAYVAAHFPRAVETTTVEVTDVVFTSATTAAVHFRLDYEGGASLGNRTGEAVLTRSGTWKVTRDTYCKVLAGAGTSCRPVPPLPDQRPEQQRQPEPQADG